MSVRSLRPTNKLQQNWQGYLFCGPALIVLLLMVVYPMVYGIVISFFDTNLVNKFKVVNLKWYKKILSDPSFYASLWRTLFFAILSVAGRTILAIVFSNILVKETLPCKKLFRSILVLPWFFPDVVIGILWKWLYDANFGLFNYVLKSLHLVNSNIEWLSNTHTVMLAVIAVSIWKGFPFMMIMLLAALGTIPKDLYEAADLDGCNGFQQFAHVTLPGIFPVLSTTIMLEFMWCFKHFTIIWNLTNGGPVDATTVVSIDIYKVGFQYLRYGESAARAVLVFIIIIVMTALQKSFAKAVRK
ncbi:MAG: sugar ABC transporter permease [Spirochaetales bacterium]|nr:sugar ABC transporter permease [Spirochaetales bacterium]